MNKIINLNFQNHLVTKQKRGGVPNYKTPLNFHNYDKFVDDLKAILEKMKDSKENKEIFLLFHKDKIPAISNRLNETFQVIFENKKLEYISNILKKEDRLGFYYEFSYFDIESAIDKLINIKEIIEKILQKCNIDLATFFNALKDKNDSQNLKVCELVKTYFNNTLYVSKTSLIKILSLITFQYESIIINDLSGTISSNDHTIVDFCSKERTNEAFDLLRKQSIKVIKISDTSIDVTNNKKEIKLNGIIKVEGYDVKKVVDDDIGNDNNYNEIFEAYYQQYYNETTSNNVRVGVIDGGVGSGIIKKYLNYHPITEFSSYDISKTFSDSHAEDVCSILLFSDQINEDKNKDNCRRPIVDLFDVCYDGITSGELINLIETIVNKYYKSIKIWNLSISAEHLNKHEIIWSEGISNFAMKLDEIQHKYNVLFIIASGNKEDESNQYITSPSDSMLGISVASVNFDESKTEYSLSGNYSSNKFYALKPDIAVSAIDNDGSYIAFSSEGRKKVRGTSFATPLVTRKVAELYADGIELFAIPALLNAVAIFYNDKTQQEKELYVDSYVGYGILPKNIEMIKNLDNNNCVIVSKINIKNYNEGFFKLKLPKTNDNHYDLNTILSVNVDANFSKLASFEYVEDTIRMQFGAVDPFNEANNSLHTNWKLDEIIGDADDCFIKENDLRKAFNKFKNRYCSCKIISKDRQSYIMNKGIKKDITDWGMSFTRNDIRSKRKESIDVYFCLIFSSINKNQIYNEIYNMNSIYLQGDLEISNSNSNDITFE